MIPYELEHNSESFIGAWLIDEDLCDTLVKQYDERAHVAYKDDSGFRNYSRITSEIIDSEVDSAYVKEVVDCIKQYTEKYRHCLGGVPFFFASVYNIQRYEPGDYYNRWHAEDPGPRKGKLLRILTVMTYLNDIEEGGCTEFLYQNVKVKPKKGLTLIWPAGWTHPHRGIPAPDEAKYIATGWCCYDHRC